MIRNYKHKTVHGNTARDIVECAVTDGNTARDIVERAVTAVS